MASPLPPSLLNQSYLQSSPLLSFSTPCPFSYCSSAALCSSVFSITRCTALSSPPISPIPAPHTPHTTPLSTSASAAPHPSPSLPSSRRLVFQPFNQTIQPDHSNQWYFLVAVCTSYPAVASLQSVRGKSSTRSSTNHIHGTDSSCTRPLKTDFFSFFFPVSQSRSSMPWSEERDSFHATCQKQRFSLYAVHHTHIQTGIYSSVHRATKYTTQPCKIIPKRQLPSLPTSSNLAPSNK